MSYVAERLVLVSNRLPYQLKEEDNRITLRQSDGGLVSALKSLFEKDGQRQNFSEVIWAGSADFSKGIWKRFQQQSSTKSFFVEPLFIEPKLYGKYYNGFCNATLWPLFHYFPSIVFYDEDAFQAYEQVNRLFADHLLSFLKPTDTVWIHDYQLFLLPQLLREKMPELTIGFFLHIPFPSYEVFRLLHRSWKEKIIKGLLGSDLVGFHTHEYVQHFLKTVRMVTGLDHHFRSITFEQRLVKVDLFPLGIDVEKFQNAANKPSVIKRRHEIRDGFKEKKILFSVDRLDYTKGITHRLNGFEIFLEKYPHWRGNVVFILVVVPSREIISKYNERLKLIEEFVGRLNGKYSTLTWQPVIYRYSHLEFEELCAMYTAADVALITPLRDGMNLVAKEYVASQTSYQGVLILSELAGAAYEMGEALMINPLDSDELANAIEQALTMPLPEQERKLKLMQKRLSDYDVTNWLNDFLNQLQNVKEAQSEERNKYLDQTRRAHLVEVYRAANKRQFFLDYDGTLITFAKHPSEAIPGEKLLQLIKALGADPRNNVTIISGRDANTLEKWFSELPVNLVAEHGISIRRLNKEWTIEKDVDQSWKNDVKPTLDLFVKRCPGSFVEEKNHTLAWHYRTVDMDLGFVRSRELLESLFHLTRNAALQVIDGNKVIEVRVAGIDKGTAVKKLLDSRCDLIMAIGDDKTDEDMFRAMPENAITVKVGAGHSFAAYSLSHPRDVLNLLNEMASPAYA